MSEPPGHSTAQQPSEPSPPPPAWSVDLTEAANALWSAREKLGEASRHPDLKAKQRSTAKETKKADEADQAETEQTETETEETLKQRRWTLELLAAQVEDLAGQASALSELVKRTGGHPSAPGSRI